MWFHKSLCLFLSLTLLIIALSSNGVTSQEIQTLTQDQAYDLKLCNLKSSLCQSFTLQPQCLHAFKLMSNKNTAEMCSNKKAGIAASFGKNSLYFNVFESNSYSTGCETTDGSYSSRDAPTGIEKIYKFSQDDKHHEILEGLLSYYCTVIVSNLSQ
eukprot:gb/GECH01011303.1/.p1 GENE.gb/GECH01011303.1/~~gb/GECH01011303.1/.p1  ORF type:complete len:156 (+),score=24.51 gb/GECH01011303.1/:1-468(+)